MIEIISGLTVNRIGLGCMGMSEFYGSYDDAQSLKVMAKAVELGVNCFDTADLYGNGHNEELIGRFIKASTIKPAIATKCGIIRHKETLPDGNFKRSYNGSPEYIKKSCEASLKRLGVDCVDIFYLHRADPNTPIEESVQALASLISQGKTRAIGLSGVDLPTLQRAQSIHSINCLQSEFSLWSREVETDILPYCQMNDITFVAFSPLGRGLIQPSIELEKNDFRNNIPRFSQKNIISNKMQFDILSSISKKYSVTGAQVSLAWILQKHPSAMVIPGTRRLNYLHQNISSKSLLLSDEDLETLELVFSPEKINGAGYLVNDNS